MSTPDGVVSANLGAFKGLVKYLKNCYTVTSMTKPIDGDLLDVEISATTQLKLFNIIYKKLEDDVKRICSKSDTILEYGEVDWDNLDKVIKTVLIDLRYRGDYTSSSRMKIQQHVSNNDLIKFKGVINEMAN